jgi:hypothetical protein
LDELPTPCKSGGEPNLFASNAGELYLSWVEYIDDTTDALHFSRLENRQWSTPKEIARSSNWFVNWADFPSLVAYPGNGKALAAHWLQKSAAGTYDYDVRIAQSTDGGSSWGTSFTPHTDGVSAEHGFVSLLPLSEDRIFAVWLDGRHTKTSNSQDGHHHGHSGGPMTLRTATFDRAGKLYDEAELDDKVCDCCQTAVAKTSKGFIVAYRDRLEGEIRDICFVRQTPTGWTAPTPVFKDNWHMTACPVNGPALAAAGETVALAWYTATGGKPQVKVAFSKDAGATFGEPVNVDEGNPLGRVDVAFVSPEKIWVSWMENKDSIAQIRALEMSAAGGKGASWLIAEAHTSRRSGFPVMVKSGNRLFFAWTHAQGDETTVKTGSVPLR